MTIFLVLAGVILVVMIFLWRRFKSRSLRVTPDVTCGFYGAPGTGKTFMCYRVIADSYLTQLRRYQRCQGKLFGRFWRWLKPNWNLEPSIYSSIPMQIYGSHHRVIYQAQQLKVEHLLLMEPLPKGANIYIGEFGKSVASQFDFDNPYVKENLTQLVSWIRQWVCLDVGKFVVDEQAPSSIVKCVRIRLGHQYVLSNFRRFLFFRYAVIDVREYDASGDDQIEVKRYDKNGVEIPQYFLVPLPYPWEKREQWYDTYCYSGIYPDGMSSIPDFDYMRWLKTNYVPVIECSYRDERLYKQDRVAFRRVLYRPMHARKKISKPAASDDVSLPV